MQTVDSPARVVVARIAAATLGAYAFSFGFTALVTALANGAGLAYGEASSLATMLALLLLLVLFCWSFAARSLLRAWVVLAGGAAAMTAAAWVLARSLSA